MPGAASSEIARAWERAMHGESLTGLDDAALLQRFHANRDPLAFEMLVERHGPMILATCRRLLPADPHTAEDAFQATFLVLVKRARSIRDPSRLGPWLYGVAHRVARRASRDLAKRRAREQGSATMQVHEPSYDPEHATPPLGADLHHEINRLPRAYREVIILCDLQRHTHEQTARLLGWPLGTVKGRLARAREQLRKRLERHDAPFTGAAVSTALALDAATTLPKPLLKATVNAAHTLAASSTTTAAASITPSIINLANGAIHSMTLSKLTLATSALLAVATFTTAGAWVANNQFGRNSALPAQDAQRNDASKPATVDAQAPADDPAVAEAKAGLERAHLAVLERNYKTWSDRFVSGLPQWDAGAIREVRNASIALMQASPTVPPAQAAEAHLNRMLDLESKVSSKLKELWENIDPSSTLAAGGVGIARGNFPVFALGYGDTQLPEVGVLVAEARLWAVEAKSGKPLTDIESTSASASTTTSARLDPRTRAILAALDRPTEFNFPAETSLKDFLAKIREQTKSQALPKGLPFYVNPAGLLEAEKTLDSPVSIELDEVPLKTGLSLALQQLDLGFYVKDQIVFVTYIGSEIWGGEPWDGMGDPPIRGYGIIPKLPKPAAEASSSAQKGAPQGPNLPGPPTGGGFR